MTKEVILLVLAAIVISAAVGGVFGIGAIKMLEAYDNSITGSPAYTACFHTKTFENMPEKEADKFCRELARAAS